MQDKSFIQGEKEKNTGKTEPVTALLSLLFI